MKIRVRKSGEGQEAEMVKGFLDKREIFFNPAYEYLVFTEVIAEAGIPDVLIIGWDKEQIKEWSPNRNTLSKNDIKIMHHISSFKKRGVLKSLLQQQLGYTKKEMKKSIKKLEASELITNNEIRVYAKDLEKNFFIKQIITIEAKIKNWKNAYQQAQLNENFSSHSYVLLPNNIINDRIHSTFNNRIGLLGYEEGRIVFKKRARKGKIPASYFSWIINEHIGRKMFSFT